MCTALIYTWGLRLVRPNDTQRCRASQRLMPSQPEANHMMTAMPSGTKHMLRHSGLRVELDLCSTKQ